MKNVSLFSLLILTLVFSTYTTFSQDNEWVNQVVVVNGGRFETSEPYTDYVTVQSYNPASQQTTVFGTIYTQSVQDIVIHGNMAYVAAQDSIIMYNLDNYQRVAAVSDSGLSKLCYFNNRLIVTKKAPITRFFVEVLDATNLALLARVQDISGECGGAIYDKDTIYVAVNYGTDGTVGKMACIAVDTWTVAREINFGEQAVGIFNLYNYGGNIVSVNKTPVGGATTGSITLYNLFSRTFENKVLTANIGYGCGIRNNLLYLIYNGGVGSFDINTGTMVNTQVIPAPTQPNVMFNSAAIDYVEGNLYLQTGNRPPTFGIGVVASSQTGDSLTSYPTGLNADAVAIDYRTPVGVQTTPQNLTVTIHPNPVSHFLRINAGQQIKQLTVFDITGRIVYSTEEANSGNMQIDCSAYPAGVFFVSITTESNRITKKFIRQ